MIDVRDWVKQKMQIQTEKGGSVITERFGRDAVSVVHMAFNAVKHWMTSDLS